MMAVNGHFSPLQNCLRITLIPSAFPPRQNNMFLVAQTMWKTILYTGNVDTCTSLYKEENVDTSIYQETYCPGNVDTSLNRDDNVDTSKY